MKFSKNKRKSENNLFTNDSDIDSSKVSKTRLFKKYFAYLSIIILIATTGVGIIMMEIVSKQYKNQELQYLHGTAANIAALSSDLLSVSGGGDYITDYQNALSITCYAIKTFSENSETDIFISAPNGKILICKEILDIGNEFVENNICTLHGNITIPAERMEKIKSGEQESYIGKIDKNGSSDFMLSAAPLTLNDKDHTLMGYVFVAKDDINSLQTALNSIRIQLILSSVFSAVIAFIIIYKVIYGFAQPLQSILYATRKYAQGDFSYRIKENSVFGEMRELTTAFNTMANDLSSIENSRRNFVANVSHELKTPMTTIGGFIDGILDGTIPPSQHKKYLRTVSDEVKRLSRLISSMLNMSRIEAGEITPSYAKFNLSEMIIKTFLSFEQIISQANINVEGLDTIESLTVSADPDMINQVIYNIIDNAVKFTPQDGKIEVSCKKEFSRAIVKIRNYGIGVENEELRMLFDRFYKADKSRSLNTKSVGLGLYICKNIIELHSGRIYATSKDNEYTEFTVELPIRHD